MATTVTTEEQTAGSAAAAAPAPPAPPAGDDLKRRIADYWTWRSQGFERAQGVRNQAQKRAWLDFLRAAAGAAPLAALDVGTGTGFLALLLAELGHDCKGIDLAPGMVEQARDLARQRGVAVRFEVGDAESLAEADAAYDLVISRNLLWTLPDPRRALLDWRRVLKPGGRLLLVDGDWFDQRPSYRLQKFLGNLWIALTRLRNPWAEERRVRREYSRRAGPADAGRRRGGEGRQEPGPAAHQSEPLLCGDRQPQLSGWRSSGSAAQSSGAASSAAASAVPASCECSLIFQTFKLPPKKPAV